MIDTFLDIEEKQHEILENFDFERVQIVMKALNWKWCQSRGYNVPSIDEIQLLSLGLIRNAIKEYNNTGASIRISSGGFSALVTEGGKVVLEFVVERTETETMFPLQGEST